VLFPGDTSDMMNIGDIMALRDDNPLCSALCYTAVATIKADQTTDLSLLIENFLDPGTGLQTLPTLLLLLLLLLLFLFLLLNFYFICSF